MTFCVGLTGGIGSGKTTVTDLFAELGVAVVDTDVISRRLTEANGAAIPAIRNQFGAEFIDSNGALDRSRMRDLVFSDASAKQYLETILHPLILAAARKAVMSAKSPYVLLVVPLLMEATGYQGLIARTLVVDCPEAMQLERVILRSQLRPAQAQAIIDQQLDRQTRLSHADDVIHNDTEFTQLAAQVQALHQHYLKLAQQTD